LTTQFAGQNWQWQAELVRVEGQIDARNRLLYAVVEVKQPYAVEPKFPGRPPLTAGMFVRAEIESAIIEQVFALPRSALRFGRELWLLDEQDQLVKKPVEVLYKDQQSIYLTSGLQNFDRVIISALDLAIDGMALKPLVSTDQQATEVVQ
jgi:multidrug efflux pump subunit AcrA (membrane-fusion protein)